MVGGGQSQQSGAAPVSSATGQSTAGNLSIRDENTSQNLQIPADIYKWSKPFLTGLPRALMAKGAAWLSTFLTGSGSQTEFDVTPIKQTTKKILTGAGTRIWNSANRLFRARSDSGLVPHNAPSREFIPGSKNVRLNRQIRELKHDVTYRKQKAATCSNRQKNQKRSHAFLPLIYSAQNLPRSLNAPAEN